MYIFGDVTETKRRRRDNSGGKRARTRAALIAAASALVGEKGYERTSLEDVAERAGMTRGAIYGNFKNRDELFLAIAGTRWKPIAPPFRPGAPLKEQMRILGRTVAEAARERRPSAVGAASFQVYALTHSQMRARLARDNAEIYRWASDALLQFVKEKDLPMPADKFVRVLHALTDGLLFLHFLTPSLITDDVIVEAFVALA